MFSRLLNGHERILAWLHASVANQNFRARPPRRTMGIRRAIPVLPQRKFAERPLSAAFLQSLRATTRRAGIFPRGRGPRLSWPRSHTRRFSGFRQLAPRRLPYPEARFGQRETTG